MTSSQRWKTFVCFILIHAAALSGAATEIRLKQRVDSRGSVVLLGDIADVREDDASPPRASGDRATDAAVLARIELFPAPGVSRWRTVRRREIRELLGLHGVDLNEVRFAGAESVTVQTTKLPRLRTVTSTKPTVAAKRQSYSELKPIELASQPVEASATELVLAPVHSLRRGEIIRQSDIAMIPVPVSGKGSVNSLGIQPVVYTEEVIGMVAKSPIAANRPLDLRSLERPLVVRRGDLVTVTSLAPGVRVETVARAVDNAALGDLVLLESLVNRKKYTARVTGNKVAEVYASGIRVSSPPQRQVERNELSSSQRRAAP